MVHRVPESKYWLLQDLRPHLNLKCPDIDFSAEAFERLSLELGVELELALELEVELELALGASCPWRVRLGGLRRS